MLNRDMYLYLTCLVLTVAVGEEAFSRVTGDFGW